MMRGLLLVILAFHVATAAQNGPQWQTLNGNTPVVVARGGYSGLFPESSLSAYQFATTLSVPGTIVLCDLQMSKDGTGYCHSDLRLDNFTTIASVYPKGQKTYTVNGEPLRGWFGVDYTMKQLLSDVSLVQNIFSRPSAFDGNQPLSLIEDVTGLQPAGLWINVQYNTFFKEHNLDAAALVLKMTKVVGVDYISSPEVGFLKSMNGKLKNTKLVFQFLQEDAVEPTTNITYGSILEDLSSIKAFASAIVVPKTYIWPVGSDMYLQAPTTLVNDAHKAGLEVYASGFANDMPGSYNYSYDPTAEYLQFIDNSDFSVDGLLTDFPSTASEAVVCLAHNKNNTGPVKGAPLVITHNGASGIYAGCTDLAYQKAVNDGADILDCSVQMSKDGIAFCLDSADLTSGTTAVLMFSAKSTTVPEIQEKNGIFSFDLTWSEIQSLKPAIMSPFLDDSRLLRNPAAKNQGKLMTLSDFLDFAKAKAVSGILLNIENAAYLASKKGLGIVDAVSEALTKAIYDKQTKQQVYIQSDDTSVLTKFKQVPSYKRVLKIDETISDAPKAAADKIKQFADAVSLPRSSIISPSGDGFLVAITDVLDEMHAANLSVLVSVLRNEYTAIAFDFFSDPMVEMATYVTLGVDGLVTEFPATAKAYIRSPCFDPEAKLPYSILAAEPGNLLSASPSQAMTPANPPAPALDVADVVDPPLPDVAKSADGGEADAPAAAPPAGPLKSGQTKDLANVAIGLVIAVLSLVGLSCHS